jgi:probable phosphoglycerate mutase
MTLTLSLLRHGQTQASQGHLFCGARNEVELTADGVAMAEAFAAAYRDVRWSGIYCSPQGRARATAAPLAAATGITPEITDDLREIDYGAWEGLTVEETDRRYHDDYVAWTADPAWNPPTGGETAVALAARVARVVEAVKRKHPAGDVLLVSHKATLRVLLCALLGIDVGRFRYRLDCPTASLSVVEFAPHGPLLKVLADRSHLGMRLRELPGT